MYLDVISQKISSGRVSSSSWDSGFIRWLNSSIISLPSWTYLLLRLQKWPFVKLLSFSMSELFHFLAFNLIFLFAWRFNILYTILCLPPLRKSSAFMLSTLILSSVPCLFLELLLNFSLYNLSTLLFNLCTLLFTHLSGFCSDALVTSVYCAQIGSFFLVEYLLLLSSWEVMLLSVEELLITNSKRDGF